MKSRRVVIFLLLFIAAGYILAFMIYRVPLFYQNDVTALNRVAKEVEENWEHLSSGRYEMSTQPFAVLTADGKVRYQSEEKAVTSMSEALKEGMPILNIEKNGKIYGRVIFTNGKAEQFYRYKQFAARCIFLLFAVLAAVGGSYFLYLRKHIIKPFLEFNFFAKEVANGNLEIPLKMKRDNIFGSFAESFDLMREELKAAREREAEAKRKQKEIIASLSHDIKTPVTSIKLTSELLMELVKEEKIYAKIDLIHQKSEQIDALVSNLFQTTLKDMEHLEVCPMEIYSDRLKQIVKSADYQKKIKEFTIPDCMVWLDELRFSQVMSNIIYNSYKYANTEMKLGFSFTDSHLKIEIKDFGNSLSEDELPLLFNRFYRGGNAAKEHGSGLGLYICKNIMEQMQGEIYCSLWENGFCVVLFLKLVS